MVKSRPLQAGLESGDSVTLSADEAARFAVVLEDHQEALVTAWTERVASTLRGRLSHAELQRQNTELRRGFQQALAGAAQDLSGEPAAELRAQLAELSATRARQGFSATETAVSIFTFKDAVLATLDAQQNTDAGTLRDYVALSSFV